MSDKKEEFFTRVLRSLGLQSLEPLFRLVNTRQEKYIFPAMENLKKMLEQYQLNPSKNNFIRLINTVNHSVSYFERWELDFKPLKHAFDKLAEPHGMAPIDWQKRLSRPKASPRFQFSALNHHGLQEKGLLEWIAEKSNKFNDQLAAAELAQLLVEYADENGFTKKVSQHLSQDPDFLFDLIMESEDNFNKMTQTSLILHLKDEQLAQAIVKHIPEPNQEEITFEQIDNLINKLNHVLTHGCSVSTLLRNANAKAILDDSIYFQIYQAEEYNNKREYSPSATVYYEANSLKPIF